MPPTTAAPAPADDATPAAAERPYALVLFGATGFTGTLVAEYLAQHPDLQQRRWALAGRSPAKLERLQQRLQCADATLPDLLQADIADPLSLRAMAASAQVVINTVGPYLEYGEQVVKACVEANTHYVDLTGEPEFVAAMIHYYDEVATRKRLNIVHCCGFDSIPHDLGALYAVQALNELLGPERAGKVPIRVEGFVTAGGTFSGGTWHSAINQFSRLPGYYRKRRHWQPAQHAEPGSERRRARQLRPTIRYRPEFSAWACPFPTIDPEVVIRSAQRLPEYGPAFRYGHHVLVRHLPTLAAGAIGVGGLVALSQLPLTRDWLLKVKDPGQGPDPEQRAKGWFKVRMIAEGDGLRAWVEVNGGDPGYGDTAKMLAESALCLISDAPLPAHYGVNTPASAMGTALITRLQRAGITFRRLT